MGPPREWPLESIFCLFKPPQVYAFQGESVLAIKESGLGKTGREGQEAHRDPRTGIQTNSSKVTNIWARLVSQKQAGYTGFSQGRADPILGLFIAS